MSDRKARVKRVQEAKTKPEPTGPTMSFWLTRDRNAEGVLTTNVTVWLAKPRRVFDREKRSLWSFWVCDVSTVKTAEGDTGTRWAQWSQENCLKQCRVYPDDEIQCLHVG